MIDDGQHERGVAVLDQQPGSHVRQWPPQGGGLLGVLMQELIEENTSGFSGDHHPADRRRSVGVDCHPFVQRLDDSRGRTLISQLVARRTGL